MRNNFSRHCFYLLFTIVSLVTAGGNYSYGSEEAFSIQSLQVLEGDTIVRIYYKINEDALNIDSISIQFFEELPNIDDTNIYINFDTAGFFDWALQNPLTQPVSFKLLAHLEPAGVEDTSIHTIIFFEEIVSVTEECDIALNLSWINYTIHHSPQSPPSPLPFDSVKVYAYPKDDDTCNMDAGILLASMPQPLWDSNETFVIPEEMEPGETYCFQIHSVGEEEHHATSNILTLELDDIVTPEKPSIRFVDVVDNQEVRLSVDGDDSDEFTYRLFRSDDGNADLESYIPVKEKILQENSFEFIDDDVPDFDNGPWYYYVEAKVTGCPERREHSEIESSVYIEAGISGNFDPDFDESLPVILNWSHEPAMDSKFYSLKRQMEGEEPEVLNGFNFDDQPFTDEIDLEQLGGIYTYWIEAEWTDNLQSEYFNSNKVYVSFDILDKNDIPRAFRPGSSIPQNQYFSLPFLTPPEADSYSMKVFDRNGLLVYSENAWDADSGWDGDVPSGGKAPAGTYVYEARFRAPGSNETESIQGTISLVR